MIPTPLLLLLKVCRVDEVAYRVDIVDEGDDHSFKRFDQYADVSFIHRIYCAN